MDMQRLRDADAGEKEAEEVPGVRGKARGHTGDSDLTAPAATPLLEFPKADRQAALDLIEWAHDDPLAEAAAPEKVREFREFCTKPWGCDEVVWRQAFDLALDIWALNQAKKRDAF